MSQQINVLEQPVGASLCFEGSPDPYAVTGKHIVQNHVFKLVVVGERFTISGCIKCMRAYAIVIGENKTIAGVVIPATIEHQATIVPVIRKEIDIGNIHIITK